MVKQLVRKRGISEDEELEVFKEQSNYDNLLMQLQSCNKDVAASCMKRQRQEEGKSDTEYDEDGCSESSSALEEEEEEEEEEVTDDEPHRSPSLGNNKFEPVLNNEIEDDAESDRSDTDQENELEVGSCGAPFTSDRTSCFNKHMEHKLSNEEVENFLKMKLKYTWAVPAVGMSNCKWSGTGEECLLKGLDIKSSNYNLKLRLYEHWLDVYKTSGGTEFHSSRQRFFFTLCNSYRDILYCNKKPFYLKGLDEDSSIMDSYIMHSLNHVFKTRDLISKNDSKMAKHQDCAEILSGEKFLDHGFTRPKVLILLPLASIAFRVIKRLIHLTPPANKVTVEHLDRLYKDFGNGDVGKNEDMVELSLNDQSSGAQNSKPSDFQALFGGNNEDLFMIGIKFTRKSIKLFGDFYSSDIIVASPLGLITKLGEIEKNKEKDVDYLSSIEVLIIDHADIIAMQNWSHVNTVIEHMNKIPSKQHGTDVMRIRQWYLDGYARFYRQSIVLGFHSNPDINGFFNRYCNNYQGKVRLLCEYKGILPKVVLQVRQVYERFEADSIADVDDARLEYFSKKVFPKINESSQGGVMLFISSYFEFVRVRNFLKAQNASFCLLGEYTKQSDISRARNWFFEGKRKIMLYTERAHFYHRYKIRGIQSLIMYSLPERKEFYPEIVNMLDGSDNMTCRVLFSSFDHLRLERIVGTVPAKRMATSEKNVFIFC